MIDIDRLIKLTGNFYTTVGSEFDHTRQSHWKGWEIISDYILTYLDNQQLSVLDLGCGNGRFLEYFLEDGRLEISSYTGVDSNEYLLQKAKDKFELLKHMRVQFVNKDCIGEIDSIEGKFNIVAAFGITHHVPSKEFRKKWFLNLADKVSENGFLVFSNWRIDLIENFGGKLVKSDLDLEGNDYILGWGDTQAKRYVHIYTDSEMKELEETLKDASFNLVRSFSDDGRNGKLNEYFVFKKC